VHSYVMHQKQTDKKQQENNHKLTFFSFPILDSSPKMYSFALGFWHNASKSPSIPLAAAQLSRASLLGLITATRKDSKLFPYIHIWKIVQKIG
jgi:hypothetical protein